MATVAAATAVEARAAVARVEAALGVEMVVVSRNRGGYGGVTAVVATAVAAMVAATVVEAARVVVEMAEADQVVVAKAEAVGVAVVTVEAAKVVAVMVAAVRTAAAKPKAVVEMENTCTEFRDSASERRVLLRGLPKHVCNTPATHLPAFDMHAPSPCSWAWNDHVL